MRQLTLALALLVSLPANASELRVETTPLEVSSSVVSLFPPLLSEVTLVGVDAGLTWRPWRHLELGAEALVGGAPTGGASAGAPLSFLAPVGSLLGHVHPVLFASEDERVRLLLDLGGGPLVLRQTNLLAEASFEAQARFADYEVSGRLGYVLTYIRFDEPRRHYPFAAARLSKQFGLLRPFVEVSLSRVAFVPSIPHYWPALAAGVIFG